MSHTELHKTKVLKKLLSLFLLILGLVSLSSCNNLKAGNSMRDKSSLSYPPTLQPNSPNSENLNNVTSDVSENNMDVNTLESDEKD